MKLIRCTGRTYEVRDAGPVLVRLRARPGGPPLMPHRLLLALGGNEAILDEVHEVEAERGAMRSQRKQLEAEVYAVLNSVTTVERLTEVWPEGLAELPPEWLAPKSVPAPLVEDLNKRIAALREAA